MRNEVWILALMAAASFCGVYEAKDRADSGK